MMVLRVGLRARDSLVLKPTHLESRPGIIRTLSWSRLRHWKSFVTCPNCRDGQRMAFSFILTFLSTQILWDSMLVSLSRSNSFQLLAVEQDVFWIQNVITT